VISTEDTKGAEESCRWKDLAVTKGKEEGQTRKNAFGLVLSFHASRVTERTRKEACERSGHMTYLLSQLLSTLSTFLFSSLLLSFIWVLALFSIYHSINENPRYRKEREKEGSDGHLHSSLPQLSVSPTCQPTARTGWRRE